VRTGSGRQRANCEHGKAGKRGRSGWREPSLQREALGVLAQRQRAVERRHSERPKHGGGSGGESFGAEGFLGGTAATAWGRS
jgi:hypothetical protein